MPRYFFIFAPPPGRLIQDDEGVDYLDVAAREAADAARAFAIDAALGWHDYSGWRFEFGVTAGRSTWPLRLERNRHSLTFGLCSCDSW